MTAELALPTDRPPAGRESGLLRRVVRALVLDKIIDLGFARDLLLELDELEDAAAARADDVIRCPHCAGAVVVDVARRVRRRRGRHL